MWIKRKMSLVICQVYAVRFGHINHSIERLALENSCNYIDFNGHNLITSYHKASLFYLILLLSKRISNNYRQHSKLIFFPDRQNHILFCLTHETTIVYPSVYEPCVMLWPVLHPVSDPFLSAPTSHCPLTGGYWSVSLSLFSCGPSQETVNIKEIQKN